MGQHKLEDSIRSALRSPSAPEPSEEVIDSIFASGTDADPEIMRRIRRRFTAKLFRDRYPEPTRSMHAGTTFADFLESRRKETRLRRTDVASALNVEERLLEDLERGRILPWKIAPSLGGLIIALYRVHLEALSRLVNTSLAVSQTGVSQAQARSSQRGHSNSRGDSASRALERFMAREAKEPDEDPEVNLWLEQVINVATAAGYQDLVEK